MGLGFVGGEKKLLLEQENIYSASILNLKMQILKTIWGLKIFQLFQILHFKRGKWTENELNFPRKITPPYEIKNILNSSKKPKILRFQLPHLTIAGGAHYEFPLTPYTKPEQECFQDNHN